MSHPTILWGQNGWLYISCYIFYLNLSEYVKMETLCLTIWMSTFWHITRSGHSEKLTPWRLRVKDQGLCCPLFKCRLCARVYNSLYRSLLHPQPPQTNAEHPFSQFPALFTHLFTPAKLRCQCIPWCTSNLKISERKILEPWPRCLLEDPWAD